MRVARLLTLAFTAAITVAGCATRPVAYAPVAGAPGIDNMVYGRPTPVLGAAPTAPYMAPPRYAAVAPASYAAPGRGLLMTHAAGPVAPPPARFAAATPSGYGAAPPRIYMSAAAPRFAAPSAYVPAGNDGPYTLDSGDRLRVVVFGQDGLTNSYAVDASGHIDMPLIGSVLAHGATSDQLAERIAERLRDGFIREPHVAVEVEAYRPFFILGEVTQPGQYPYVANMTVETAVAIAGGFGPRGVRDHVTITRNVGGRLFRFAAPTTYPIRPGDTIAVPERWF